MAVKRFGRIDVLVNNAGYSLLGNFEELAMPDVERQIETNLLGVMHVIRAALPAMRKQRSGHIINISSTERGHLRRQPACPRPGRTVIPV